MPDKNKWSSDKQANYDHQMTSRLLIRILCFSLVVACSCKEEKFDMYSYNGAYPRNMDGSQITTYTPVVENGEIKVDFNGHAWNHAPFQRVDITRFPFGNGGSEDRLEIFIRSMLDSQLEYSCSLEHLIFRVPAKNGTVDLNGFPDDVSDAQGAAFSTANCDATKDRYRLDRTKTNRLTVLNYDGVDKKVTVQFEVNFIIAARNSDFGPIFPEKVSMKGTATTIVTAM